MFTNKPFLKPNMAKNQKTKLCLTIHQKKIPIKDHTKRLPTRVLECFLARRKQMSLSLGCWDFKAMLGLSV